MFIWKLAAPYWYGVTFVSVKFKLLAYKNTELVVEILSEITEANYALLESEASLI